MPIIANKNIVKAKQKRINFKEYLFGFLYQAIAPPINTKINKFSKKEATNSGFLISVGHGLVKQLKEQWVTWKFIKIHFLTLKE